MSRRKDRIPETRDMENMENQGLSLSPCLRVLRVSVSSTRAAFVCVHIQPLIDLVEAGRGTF